MAFSLDIDRLENILQRCMYVSGGGTPWATHCCWVYDLCDVLGGAVGHANVHVNLQMPLMQLILGWGGWGEAC